MSAVACVDCPAACPASPAPEALARRVLFGPDRWWRVQQAKVGPGASALPPLGVWLLVVWLLDQALERGLTVLAGEAPGAPGQNGGRPNVPELADAATPGVLAVFRLPPDQPWPFQAEWTEGVGRWLKAAPGRRVLLVDTWRNYDWGEAARESVGIAGCVPGLLSLRYPAAATGASLTCTSRFCPNLELPLVSPLGSYRERYHVRGSWLFAPEGEQEQKQGQEQEQQP